MFAISLNVCHYQDYGPSLVFVIKARAFPNVAPQRSKVRYLAYPQTIDKDGKVCQRQTL